MTLASTIILVSLLALALWLALELARPEVEEIIPGPWRPGANPRAPLSRDDRPLDLQRTEAGHNPKLNRWRASGRWLEPARLAAAFHAYRDAPLPRGQGEVWGN